MIFSGALFCNGITCVEKMFGEVSEGLAGAVAQLAMGRRIIGMLWNRGVFELSKRLAKDKWIVQLVFNLCRVALDRLKHEGKKSPRPLEVEEPEASGNDSFFGGSASEFRAEIAILLLKAQFYLTTMSHVEESNAKVFLMSC